MVEIEICMGSSCFSRGNRQALAVLEETIAEREWENRIRLVGRLCMEKCSCGPHVVAAGRRYDVVAPEAAVEILDKIVQEALS